MNSTLVSPISLLETNYISVEVRSDNQLLYVNWKKESEQIEQDDFKKVNLLYVQAFNEHPLQLILINAKFFLFPIGLELQEWVNNEILANLALKGLKKVAFILSEEFISQLSIEQTMEEAPFLIDYFSTEEAAQLWLFN